jgi:hypothetical protein
MSTRFERRWDMPIENRNLDEGTVLEARYKGTVHRCEVVQTEEGLRYRLEDGGREFTSLSSAGSAVMGGIACNGWRFWSLADSLPEKAEKPRKTPKARKNAVQGETVQCGECGETFSSTAEATQHAATVHTQEEPAD